MHCTFCDVDMAETGKSKTGSTEYVTYQCSGCKRLGTSARPGVPEINYPWPFVIDEDDGA